MENNLNLFFKELINITHHFRYFTLLKAIKYFFYFTLLVYQCKKLGMQKIIFNSGKIVFRVINFVAYPRLVVKAILSPRKKYPPCSRYLHGIGVMFQPGN